MPHHHEDDETEETQEFRRARNGKRALMGGYAAIAGIVLAIPIAFGWVGNIYEITKTPGRVDSLETAQKQTAHDVTDMKESLARIEGALHIQKTPKQKDDQP